VYFVYFVVSMASRTTETSLWPLTAWQEIQAAGRAAGRETSPIDELFRKYRTPLRVHLLRRFRSFPVILSNVDDLLQEFAAAKILKEGWLQKSDPRKGRFRDFLRKSLENLVWSWWKQQPEYKAWLKHKGDVDSPDGPESETQDLQSLPEPAVPEETADFNLAWVQSILTETLERMENDCKDGGKERGKREYIWEVFRLRILEPIFDDTEPIPYEQLVERFDLRSPTEASNMLLTAKRMFHRHLNAVIAEYEAEGGAEIELDELKRIVARLSKDSCVAGAATAKQTAK
jgi:hypothetical protein